MLRKKYNTLKQNNIKKFNIATISSLCTEEISNKEGYSSQNAIDLYLYNKAVSDNKTFEQIENQNFQYELLASLSKEVPNYYLNELSRVSYRDKISQKINCMY